MRVDTHLTSVEECQNDGTIPPGRPSRFQELEVAISAAKQGKLKDAQLTHCMLKIDNELHLWHLRICDLFDRLVRARRCVVTV